jgi:ATP-dependent Clp protease ATP-binding subunit ClpC
LKQEIERYFRPEFINRLDDVMVFRPLQREHLVQIVEYELNKLRSRLGEKDIELELDDSAKEFLIKKGYNPDYGARPLRRAIEQYVEDPLSEALLKEEFKGGQVIKVSRQDSSEETEADGVSREGDSSQEGTVGTALTFTAEDKPEPAESESDQQSGNDGGDGGDSGGDLASAAPGPDANTT